MSNVSAKHVNVTGSRFHKIHLIIIAITALSLIGACVWVFEQGLELVFNGDIISKTKYDQTRNLSERRLGFRSRGSIVIAGHFVAGDMTCNLAQLDLTKNKWILKG